MAECYCESYFGFVCPNCRPQHVPPTIYGPAPADPDELARSANELVAEIQKSVDEQHKPAESAVIGIVLSMNDARRKRDEQEERRLEQLVIERWTGKDESDAK